MPAEESGTMLCPKCLGKGVESHLLVWYDAADTAFAFQCTSCGSMGLLDEIKKKAVVFA